MSDNRQVLRFFTLDPLHIGVGQDIMGEVDLPIDRESETGVPRIPGTALKGGFRAHAAWKLKMDGEKPSPVPVISLGNRKGSQKSPTAPCLGAITAASPPAPSVRPLVILPSS